MTDAVIVSTARTPIGKAHRGALNLTRGADLAAHAIRGALDRARLEPEAVEEVVLGCGYPENATGGNVARHAALVAGIPVASAGVTVSRFCASGLEAIASAARRIVLDGVPVAVAGGVESISLVQPKVQRELTRNAWLEAHLPAIYMPMIETADIVAERYGISREAQDAFALESQRRTAAAQDARAVRRRDRPDERRDGGDRQGHRRDPGGRDAARQGRGQPARHDARGACQAQARARGGGLHHGRQRQPALGRGLGQRADVGRRGGAARVSTPLGTFRGFASAGCGPDEMGIGPVFAVPRLLERQGLKVADIDLWELNEAFASPVGLLPRHARDRSREGQRQRRRHRGRPPVRHVGGAARRPRPAGGPSPRRALRRGHHVRRRRPGLRRPVRDRRS